MYELQNKRKIEKKYEMKFRLHICEIVVYVLDFKVFAYARQGNSDEDFGSWIKEMDENFDLVFGAEN